MSKQYEDNKDFMAFLQPTQEEIEQEEAEYQTYMLERSQDESTK